MVDFPSVSGTTTVKSLVGDMNHKPVNQRESLKYLILIGNYRQGYTARPLRGSVEVVMEVLQGLKNDSDINNTQQ